MRSTVKVSESSYGLYALMSFRREGMTLSDTSNIQEVCREGGATYGSLVFSSNTIMNDFIVTKTGTIWAIDVLGHLHCSKPVLTATNIDPDLDVAWEKMDGSMCHFTDDIPVCMEGRDNSLWIGTHQGFLYHYDGNTFIKSEARLQGSPIRFRKFDEEQLFVMTTKGEIYEYLDGLWSPLSFSEDIPKTLTVNDVAMVNGVLYAVSITGHILKLSDEKVFEVVLQHKDISWYSCAEFNNTLHLAGEKDGAFEMDASGNLKSLKVYDQMVGISIGMDCLYFMLAENKEGSFVRYAPSDPVPWIKTF